MAELDWRTLALPLLMLSTSPSYAQEKFQPAPGWSHLKLDFDTEGGHYSSLEIPDACGINAIRGSIKATRYGENERFLPAGTIALENGSDFVSFSLETTTRKPPMIAAMKTKAGDNQLDQTFKHLLPDATGVEFAIDWTPEGRVQITFDGETLASALKGGVREIQFSGSTSEVSFEDLSLGHTGSAPQRCPLA